tara:strand:+ start:13828 stop:14529 length:702 start_codon:yes stop_codon:yes gene_type:complete
LSKNFSIIVPVFNEEDNILRLMNELLIALPLNIFKYEIIIVNDCSTDKTFEKLEKLLDKGFIKIITNKKNMGQSYSIKQGIKNSFYETIVNIDGDCQNNPLDIPKLLDLYFSDKEIKLVGGIRKNRKDNFIKIYSSKIANSIRSFILKDDCTDTGCSLKVIDKKIFLKFNFFNGIHRFLPALYKGYGSKTAFIDVDHRPRIGGKSKYGTLKRLFQGIVDLIRVKLIINKLKND